LASAVERQSQIFEHALLAQKLETSEKISIVAETAVIFASIRMAVACILQDDMDTPQIFATRLTNHVQKMPHVKVSHFFGIADPERTADISIPFEDKLVLAVQYTGRLGMDLLASAQESRRQDVGVVCERNLSRRHKYHAVYDISQF